MAAPKAAAAVPLSDLGSYQHAVRLVLTYDVITATRPRPGTLEQVLRWADQMAADLRELLGYTLIATTRQVRLSRRLDALDPSQLTGLAVERRAEGIMLADAGGRFTDRPFPGRGGAVNRAAGLVLAKIADLIEDPDEVLITLPVPAEAEDQRDLLARIDSALPAAGVVQELAWSVPAEAADDAERAGARAPGPLLAAPFVELSRLRAIIGELYDELGATSFGITWQHDPGGLLAAALSLLADLRLLRPVPGGAVVLPAAARYRNIKLALPVRHADGQLALDFGTGDPDE